MSKPLYTTVASVKVRLANKVQFQAGIEPVDGELPDELLCQLISDAETDVEMELRSRYAVPFTSIKTGSYARLPDHTQRVIRKLVDARAAMLVMAIDFGTGTVVDAEKYYKSVKEQYEDNIQLALGRDRIGRNDKIDRHKVSPPLDDLMLALTNSMADDGYRGTVINTYAPSDCYPDAVGYADDQLDNPADSFTRRSPGRW